MSESTKIIILSKSQDIKKHESVKFLMKGKELTIDSLIISSQSVHMGFVTGETKSIEITEKNGKSIISRIASSLNNEKINTDVEYDAKEFNREYLPELSEILSSYPKSTQKGNEGIFDINNRSTTESNRAVGTTTELFNFEATKELERSTTEGINHITQAIATSNTNNEITTENIGNVFRFANKSKNISERLIFDSRNVQGPNLPETGLVERLSNTTEGQMATVAAIASWAAVVGLGGVVGIIGVVAGYCMWHRKKREGSYDLENAQSDLDREQTKPLNSGNGISKNKDDNQTEPKVVGALPKTPADISQSNDQSHDQLIRQMSENLESLRSSLSSSSLDSVARLETEIREATSNLDHSEVFSLENKEQYSSQEIQKQLQAQAGSSNPPSSLLLSSNLKKALDSNSIGLS